MGLLGTASALAYLSACYAPDLRDCTVVCSSARDCIGGQLCSDGLCAATERSCSSVPIDAAVFRDATARDAPIIDAPDEAPMFVELRLDVGDGGSVEVEDIGTCFHAPPFDGRCWFLVPRGEPLTLRAIAYPGYKLEEWDYACKQEDSLSCTLTPHSATRVSAKFERTDR